MMGLPLCQTKRPRPIREDKPKRQAQKVEGRQLSRVVCPCRWYGTMTAKGET